MLYVKVEVACQYVLGGGVEKQDEGIVIGDFSVALRSRLKSM